MDEKATEEELDDEQLLERSRQKSRRGRIGGGIFQTLIRTEPDS